MKKLIGNKAFYLMVLGVAVPIMIQNGITNFVGMLDNIMVGRVGTDQMSGVAIVNQLLFVFNLCIFGGVSGAGVFGAQFFGQKNHEGVRDTFRYKMIISGVIVAVAYVVFIIFGEDLISLYLHDGSKSGDLEATARFAKGYLNIMLIELIPFAVIQVYAGTLRETGETVLPMKAGMGAVAVNLVLNYILIFGKFGAPKLGVEGAAIATVISRFVELGIVLIWTHRHKEQNAFIVGAYKQFKIPKNLAIKITVKGVPLLLNEGLWSAGQAMLLQCYSVRGLAIVAGLNISNTIANLFNIVFLALGSSISIVVGQMLGAGKRQEAKDTAYKMTFFAVACCLVLAIIMSLGGRFFPYLYNVEPEVRKLASMLIVIAALTMPIHAYMNATYFTLRSGGKTFITFLFDSVYMWVVSIPLAYGLAHYTEIPILYLFLAVQLIDLVKCAIGFFMVKSGIWIQNIVDDK